MKGEVATTITPPIEKTQETQENQEKFAIFNIK